MDSWTTANNDQVTNWATYQTALQAQIDRLRDLPRSSGAKVSGPSAGGTAAYAGAVVLPDSRVYLVPYVSTTAKIYDWRTNSVVNAGGTFPGAHFQGGVLMKDGRVFCVPRDSTSARIYDPKTDSLSTPSGTFPGNDGLYGGCLLPDGKVFCSPGGSNRFAYIYDPIANSVSTVQILPSVVNDAFYGCVLMADGKVFMTPRNVTSAYIYDHSTGTVSTVSGYPAIADAFYGSVLMADGRVFSVPLGANGSTTARIYDPSTGTVSTPSGTYGNYFLGGCLLADGRVFVCPRDSNQAKIYDPVTDTLVSAPGSYVTNSGQHSCVLMGNGNVLVVPTNATTIQIALTGYGVEIDPQVTTSPFFNKL